MATYYTYNAGVEAKHLHLGNLVHDYKHPNELEPYVEKAYTDISEPPPEWAQSGSLENYALTLGTAPRQSTDFEDDPADGAGVQGYRVVAAAKTTRLEIKDPEEFFNEHTLASAEAKKWLSSHLSAAESLAQGKPGPRPQIWMLTGLIVMQHATWTRLSSKEKFVAGQRAPFNPTGVSAIRRSSVSDGVRPTFGYRANEEEKHIPGGHIIHETGKYPGARGWAAQWQRVDTKVLTANKGDSVASNQITLKRAPMIASVKLREDVYAENNEDDDDDDEDEDFDEAYWDSFIDEVDD